jgi:hypothetical protein
MTMAALPADIGETLGSGLCSWLKAETSRTRPNHLRTEPYTRRLVSERRPAVQQDQALHFSDVRFNNTLTRVHFALSLIRAPHSGLIPPMKADNASHKDTAVSFLRLVGSGKVRDAYDRFVSANFRHHNGFFPGRPRVTHEGNGRETPGRIPRRCWM